MVEAVEGKGERLVLEKPAVLLREREIERRVGFSRVTLWRWVRAGRFPSPRRIGTTHIGWLEDEVEAWIRARPATQGRR